MIIKELILHNFGVYAGQNEFSFTGQKPVVLIGGLNGRGKTTFLEAVLLALYGSNSFAYQESQFKSYGQYLKSYVNMSDQTGDTFIELEFEMEKGDNYRIKRNWSGLKQRVQEEISVYKDDEYNQFLTDNWNMFIENILPSGLSNFFFFDGEKIAELAVENTSSQMKESIKSLLGITLLDSLDNDVNRILKRLSKNNVDNQEANEIDKIRGEKEKLSNSLELKDKEIEVTQNEIDALKQNLEEEQQKFSAKGGDIVTQRQELFERRAELQSQINANGEHLLGDAASELPFVLVKDLLRNIRENAEIEQEEKNLQVAYKKMKSVLKKYESENGNNSGDARAFVEYFSEMSKKSKNNVSYNMSDLSLFKLQNLLDEQLTTTKLNVIDRQNKSVGLREKADQLDSYLSVDIDEKAINNIYKKIKKIEQSIIDKEVQLDALLAERRTINGELITVTALFNKQVESYLKKVEMNDDSERLVKYSHIALSILDQYKLKLQEKKIDVVASTMTECYKMLANKKNLIERIDMDPVTLDLVYINSLGEEVPKTSLSAGEKQLMVIALLWSLAKCSKQKLPVIIDTPLSRLDSMHRLALIEVYFPQASAQTIILSTDSEIDEEYYGIMKKDISDEYTLVYDDKTRTTSVRTGYFMEASK